MDELRIWTEVEVPPSEAFALLHDFPGYAKYSEYLTRVEQHGEGGPGTVYDITAEWWRIGYSARTEVTAIEAGERIEWRVLEAIDASGTWEVEPAEPEGSTPSASRVILRIRYDPSTASARAAAIPRFVSLAWVIEKVRPLIVREAEAVVERIVADLEGERRPVDLHIETRTG